MKDLKAYLSDESGQTSTEYILLVAVVAMIVLRFKNVASTNLQDITNDIFEKIGVTIEQGLSEES